MRHEQGLKKGSSAAGRRLCRPSTPIIEGDEKPQAKADKRPRRANASAPRQIAHSRLPAGRGAARYSGAFAVQRPEPKGELEHVNAFTLLVAVVLSAQATDAGVNKATRAAVCRCRHAAKNAGARRGEAGACIRTIGLWRGKAKNVIALSQALIRDHGGEVPTIAMR